MESDWQERDPGVLRSVILRQSDNGVVPGRLRVSLDRAAFWIARGPPIFHGLRHYDRRGQQGRTRNDTTVFAKGNAHNNRHSALPADLIGRSIPSLLGAAAHRSVLVTTISTRREPRASHISRTCQSGTRVGTVALGHFRGIWLDLMRAIQTPDDQPHMRRGGVAQRQRRAAVRARHLRDVAYDQFHGRQSRQRRSFTTNLCESCGSARMDQISKLPR
jgi:hypothetical protein